MQDRHIRALMIKAQSKPVVIFCPCAEYAEAFRQEVKDGVSSLFPTLVNTYIGTGPDVFIKGHEKITVTTVGQWNESQRKALDLFKGYAFAAGCTIDDIYGVKNLMYEPERFEAL